jgi:RHS repeat-associated protein
MLGGARFTAAGQGFISIDKSQDMPSGNSPYTLEGWIQLADDGNGGDGEQTIVAYGQYGGGSAQNVLETSSHNALDNVWWGDDLASGSLTDMRARWHYAAVTYDGTNRTLYQDGIEVAHDTPGSNAAQAINLTLGAWNGANGRFLNGMLAGVAVYGYAPLHTLQAHYAAGLGGPLPTPTVSAYSAAILKDGPRAYWPLDEQSGQFAHDLTGNGYDGALQNTTVFTTTAPAGMVGSANFDGSYGPITMAQSSGLPSGSSPFTLEGWVHLANNTDNEQALVGYGTASTDETNALDVASHTAVRASWWSNDLVGNQGPDLSSGWHHVAVTYDGSIRTVVEDGYAVGMDTPVSPTISLGNLMLGSLPGANNLQGQLAGVAIYNTALPLHTLQAHYAAGLGSPLPTSGRSAYSSTALQDGPIAYWPLDAGTGDGATDLTGNGHDALLPAGASFDASAPAGMVGSAAFSGNQVIAVAKSSDLPSGNSPYTLEGWVHLVDDGNGGDGAQDIVAYGQFGAPTAQNVLETNSHNALDNVWWDDDLSKGSLADMRQGWHYAAVTYDGTTRTLYQDGVAVAQDTPKSAGFVSSNLLLGCWGGSRCLSGNLAGVAIYGRALTAGQIAGHYAAGTAAGQLTASPASIVAPTSQATVILSFASANWLVTAPVFSLTNSDGAAATLVGQVITGQTTASVTIATNGRAGTVTIADPSTGRSVAVSLIGIWPTSTPTGTPAATAAPTSIATVSCAATVATTRAISYTYDGIGELTGAAESPGCGFAYSYDPAGNRTGVTIDGSHTARYTYNAANEVNGWLYDAAGNLTNDGGTTYAFDALGRLTGTTAGSTKSTYAYNGDGTLVSASVNGTSTTYTQDLAGGMSQILASATGSVLADYLRDDGGTLLASLTGGTRTWYGTDNQGSVRQTLDDSAAVLATQSYDPYGNPETSGDVGIFGYTGELQSGASSAEYLRARWYQPGTGTLLGGDPELDTTGQAYAYAGDDPVNGGDPSGDCWEVDRANRELDNFAQVTPVGLQRSTDSLKRIAQMYTLPSTVYDLPTPAVDRLLDQPGIQFVTWGYQASEAVSLGARLILGAPYVASGDDSGGTWWTRRMLDAFGSTVTKTGQIVEAALPVIHDVAVGVSVLATGCAIASSETVIGGVSCGAIAFAATAAAETGSILSAEHRESDTAATLDEASLALGGIGHLAELGAAISKGLAENTELVAASKAEAAATAGLEKLGPWILGQWWTIRADFWSKAGAAFAGAASVMNGVAATLTLLGVGSEVYDTSKGDCK